MSSLIPDKIIEPIQPISRSPGLVDWNIRRIEIEGQPKMTYHLVDELVDLKARAPQKYRFD